MSRKRRDLSPEDRELWGRVVQTARPLKSAPLALPVAAATPAPPKPAMVPPPGRAPLVLRPEGGKGSVRHDLAQPLSEALAQVPVQMDKRRFQRLSRGKLDPEARIDLHGMTLAQAHGALNGFILRAHAAGLRLVLVITGKGKTVADDGPIPRRQGALKHDVPQWLRMAPLGPVVLEIREAHIKHGGAGAYYVYLRRARG
ncbi:Smr/MutS family protein [Natronohydrobacter thiooxidans]|jgi:DNA-nicking Smr family endonuclease|uniref:Smr/MutS family protein n=1 Tax=Natronohydrobacter thiooxidans TaxID=87172 RepID=UPI0008FF4276|nr:Smr/MutS family protein [Natronohydrobacter thiooxidans]